ncbi:hypothetical protein [Streptomyces sp. NPDC056683]|uniref:hypothetical protein n=1 Tax=Streptomyces sp. NPDC056683 TaxID=3345910 RepID=UPI0036D09A9E
MPSPKTPTLEQIDNLIERAERKGGLTVAEGERLRAGLRRAITRPYASSEVDDLRRRNASLTQSLRYWKDKARTVETAPPAAPVIEPAPAPAPVPPPPPAPVASAPPPAPVAAPDADDVDARDALRRVIGLAHRWAYIPAKRRAAESILAVIRNKDDE